MPTYTPPLRDMQFVMHEVFKVTDEFKAMPQHAEVDVDTINAVIEEAGKFASEVIFPLNISGDTEGCTLDKVTHEVKTPTGFKEAYDKYVEGGWAALSCDPAYGGQGLPFVLNQCLYEMMNSANQAWTMYPGLSHGAYECLHAHGTEEQKKLYLPKLTSGEWTGTMCLTEPHCGTDLGLLRTKAEPQPDGTYKLTGQKIFISAGEHDMADNIIHLVLARLPEAPEGSKGISLFIVPKFLVNEDGSLGARNAVSVGNIEEKMGIHGNSTCVMNYDGAKGWLLGDLHKGMRAMFTMMNEARLGVGLQGRAVTGTENPKGPADPLIVHPDIRRNLMDQKSFLEGARMLAFWGAHQIDRAHAGNADAEGLISLLTPVIKGFLTDKGFDTAVNAQQVFGGHGYIEEHGMSQFVRDARITMIYEGANGVQALDLVGRKLAADGGKPVMAFFEMVKSFIKENEGNAALKADFLDPLKAASKDLQASAMFFMQNGMKNPNHALAGSYDFMHLFGHVVLGFMWAQMAVAAQKSLDAGTGDAAFLNTKLATGRYYMKRQLPATAAHLARIESGADTVMALDADQF